MLRQKVPGSFVCISCRLQGLQLGGKTSIAPQRRPFALTARARSNNSNDCHDANSQHIIDAIRGLDPAPARSSSGSPNPPNPPQPSPDTPESQQPSNDNHDQTESRPVKGVTYSKYFHYSRSAARRKGGVTPLEADLASNNFLSRGEKVWIGDENLPIDILGGPGAAIVLRRRGGGPRRKVQEIEPVEPETGAAADEAMQTALDAGDEDYLLNIHELRQTNRTLTETEFNALRDTLASGFTVAQLEAYMRDSESLPREPVQEDDAPAPQAPDPEWVLSRRPWAPDATEGTKRGGDIMRGYVSKTTTPKQRLVIELLRKRWGLSCDSVAGSMGHLEVELRDVEFGLLLLGSQKWLRDITRNYLETGSQIEIVASSQSVIIRAPRTRAETVLYAINKVLAKAKTTAVDANLITPDPIDTGLLEDVGRITSSIVRTSGKQILVTWINLPEPAPSREDIGDVVLRYLLMAFHPQPRSSSRMEVLPGEQADGGRYITNYTCQSQLPWHERRKQWARWVSPSPTKADAKLEDSSHHHPILSPRFLPHEIEIRQAADSNKDLHELPVPFSGRPFPIAPVNAWSSNLITDTQAVFGQVLHAQPPQPLAPTTTPRSLDTSLSRSFVPTLPPLPALSFPSNIREEGLWHSILVLQFMPSAENPDAPPLELRIEADHAELKRIVSLRAIDSSFVGDVLFPAAPVDVRLRQDRYFELPGDGIDVHASAITKFLKDADLRPWAGKLATPPLLENLMLPKRILGSASTSPWVSSAAVTETVEQDGAETPAEETVHADTAVEEEVVQDTAEETVEATADAEQDVVHQLEEEVASLDDAVEQATVETLEETAPPLADAEQDIVEELAEEITSLETAVEHAHETVEETTPPVVGAAQDPEQLLAEEIASATAELEQDVALESAEDPTPLDAALKGQDIPEEAAAEPATSLDNAAQPAAADLAPRHPLSKPEPDLVRVSYRFAAIEVQRVVTAYHEGFKLGYRGIEGGQRGGKRSELVLRAAVAPWEPGAGARKRGLKPSSFMRVACGLAHMVEGAPAPGGQETAAAGKGVAGKGAAGKGAAGKGTAIKPAFSWHGTKGRESEDDWYVR